MYHNLVKMTSKYPCVVKAYKIVCDITEHIYVGSTSKHLLSQRMSQHRSDARYRPHKTKLHTTMSQLGLEHFSIQLLEAKLVNSREEQRMLEQKYIEELKTNLNGSNADVDAQTQKDKKNEARRIRRLDPEYRKIENEKNKLYIDSEKQREYVRREEVRNSQNERRRQRVKDKLHYCKLCDMSFEGPGLLSNHFVGQHHKSQMYKLIHDNLYCSLCNYQPKTLKPVHFKIHLEGQQHQFKELQQLPFVEDEMNKPGRQEVCKRYYEKNKSIIEEK